MNTKKKLLASLLLLASMSAHALPGRIQNEDVKSVSDIESSAGTATANISSSTACLSSVSFSSGTYAGLATGLFVYDTTTPANITSGTTIVGLPGTCSSGQIQISVNGGGTATGDTVTFGGQPSQLVNDTKIWVSSVTPAQQLSSAISSGVIGGSAGGSKNYLTTYNGNTGNGNFEFGNTTGWSLGTIGTLTNGLPTGSPTFGSGASGNLSISTVTGGSQIAGTYSLSYVSSAATTAGNMLASSAFTIDSEDQAKVMTVKFYYTAHSGASNINFSGTSSNSFAWAAWDATNSTWLTSTGNFCMVQSSGQGYCTGTLQTATNTSSMRFVFYNANASSGATTLYLDDFSVGPQTAPFGPAVTDWIAYTPAWTSSGTAPSVGNGTITGFYRRVGDSVSLQINLSAGSSTTAGTGNYFFSIPSGLSIDGTKLTGNPNSGLASVQVFYGTTNATSYLAEKQGTSTILLQTTDGEAALSQTFPASNWIQTAGHNVIINIGNLPVTGWSSNTSMSSDTDTRVMAILKSNGASQSVTNGTEPVLVSSDSVSFDTHGCYNTTTGLCSIPVTGFYKACGTSQGTVTYAGSSSFTQLFLQKNGSQSTELASFQASAASTVNNQYFNGCAELKLNAGDTIGLLYNNSSGSSVSITSSSMWITRETGPAVIAATESVNAMYNTSSQAVGTSQANLILTNKLWDSHNAYNTSTGVYTCPVSGKFHLSIALQGGTATASALPHTAFNANINKNGTDVAFLGDFAYQQTTTAVNPLMSGGGDFSCLAGDSVQVQIARDSAISAFSLLSTAVDNWMSIERVGN